MVVFATMDFTRYQVSRHSALGENVLAGPAFSGAAARGLLAGGLQRPVAVFLLILFLPFGLANAVRGWPIQVALAVPLGVLLAWHNANAKSIAFQYVTCLIVVIVLAVMVGARRSAWGRADPAAAMLAWAARLHWRRP